MPWVLFVFIMSGIIWWLKELKGDIAVFKRRLRLGMYYTFFNENLNLPKNNNLPKCRMNKSGQYETK